MENTLPVKYREWTIEIANEVHGCSGFSFDIISPSGEKHHVKMGGHTAEDARRKAKEMIDLECVFAEEE